jgi:NADH pyrophosphatase NudC (nudix superfamily)
MIAGSWSYARSVPRSWLNLENGMIAGPSPFTIIHHYVEPGEHPRSTVLRELEEELGFTADHEIHAPLMVTCTTTVTSDRGAH